MPIDIEFKEKLLQTCKEIISKRIETAEKAMKSAQEAANGEDKSSAGDKYETSRAMGHLDRDMYAKQLVEAKNELEKLLKIRIEPSETVKSGSLVKFDHSYYFIAVGIGKLAFDNLSLMVISNQSPIAQIIIGKRLNESFTFKDKPLKIDHLV
jgi:transcription elongation GreA/GreB family factor